MPLRNSLSMIAFFLTMKCAMYNTYIHTAVEQDHRTQVFDQKERQTLTMGCQESNLCFTTRHQSGRTKVTAIKKTVRYADRPKTRKNIELLDQGEYDLTEDDWDMIETILLNHQLLFKARGYANKEIMNRLENFEASAGQVIFKKGDPSCYFYIIIKGTVCISDWAEGQISKTLHRGNYFGDVGIYSKAARSATVTALTPCSLVGLKKENFLRISLELSKKAQTQVFSYIKNIPMFKQLNLHQKHKIAYLAQELKFKSKAVIFKRGEVSSCLYVVKSGKVLLTIPDRDPVEVKMKEGFGESCLNEAHPERYADATCIQPTVLLAFSKTDIQKYIGKQFLDVEIVNKFIWALKHDKTLKVSPLIMESMIQLKEIRFFEDKQVIMQRGEPIKQFIISLEGGINNNPELEVFNTDYLLDIKYHTERLIKKGKGRVAFVNIEAIEKRYNRHFNTLIDLNQTIWKQIESVNKIQQYVAQLTLHHFWAIDTKSTGEYGSTLHVKSDSNIEFAMRVIDKAQAIQQDMQTTVVNLKNVGGKLTHPLIAKQYRIFTDKYRLYFMNRWVEGEDLYDLVERQKKLSANIVRHYAACIINIMEYLHCRRIVWRELKIESFVIDHQGYLTLVDLMHLEELHPQHAYVDNPNKATFLYLAPEVLSNQGHGLQTDFWSLGIILYRLLVGEFPYGQKVLTNDEGSFLQMIQTEIQTKQLTLPNWLTSDAKIILKLLLNPQPFERSLISFTKLKSMSFFKDYDWLGLIQKKIKNIPYLPKKTVPKCRDPISVISWIERQHSVVPSPSELDEI